MPIRIQRFIAILSVFLFLAKIFAWYLTHSVAILTDALESTVNVISGFIGLYSVTLAAKPRDLNHPFGHSKVEFISAAVEGALIFISGFLIIYESIDQLIEPKPLHQLDYGIAITAITALVNFIVGVYAIKKGEKYKSATIEAAGNHLRVDAYSTFAIILGLILLLFTKWQWLDSAVAMAFAVVIIITGYKVLRKSLSGIMDESDEKMLTSVIQFLQNNRQVQWIDIHNMRVIQYGNIMHIDAHMTLPWYYRVDDGEKEIHLLEDMIAKHFGNKIEIFVHIDGCIPNSCKLCAIPNCPVRQESFLNQIIWTSENVWMDSKHGIEIS